LFVVRANAAIKLTTGEMGEMQSAKLAAFFSLPIIAFFAHVHSHLGVRVLTCE